MLYRPTTWIGKKRWKRQNPHKYDGYIARERALADKMQRLEDIRISDRFDYHSLTQLSTEARQKLAAVNPETLAQASRIPGVSPSDISVLLVLLGR